MTEPIRVLQVMASLDRGGAEAVVMDWLRRADRRKVAFDFVVNEGATYEFEPEALSFGCRVIRSPVFRGWNALPYAWWWRRCLRSHPEWRLVHAHHTVPAFIFLSVARAMDRTTVAHSHTAGQGKNLAGKLRTMLWWPLRRVADMHLACSELAGTWMFGRRVPVRIVPNGIDTARFTFDPGGRDRVREELGLTDAFVVGHVGRFSLPKNHARLLRVFATLAEEEPRARLLIVGDGRLKDQIVADIRELGLEDKVLLTGVRQDIPALLSAMDVLLFPSHYEGLPVTVVEAQASGLPCVVSDAVTPEVGLTDLVSFVSLDEPDAVWAGKVRESVSRQDRCSRIDELREAGYDSAQVAEEMQELYAELAGKRAGGGEAR